MWNDIKHHKIAYVILALALLMFITLFLAAWPNRLWQRLLILQLCVFYGAWGVITHRKLHHPLKNIALEYFGVSGLASTILFLLTL